jgi:hypothetical protein
MSKTTAAALMCQPIRVAFKGIFKIAAAALAFRTELRLIGAFGCVR